MSSRSREVVVVGAGVVGLSIAAQLAARGMSVTVVERIRPGAGTSGSTFAWVNANGKEPEAYFRLNAAGVAAHRRLAEDLGDWFGPGGHVEIAVDDRHRERLSERLAALAGRLYPVGSISAERAADLLPGFDIPRAAQLIAFFPGEGFVYPHLFLGHLRDRAIASGARIVLGRRVVGFDEVSNGGVSVLLDEGTRLPADTVVSAVGRWSDDLAALAGADLPMRSYGGPGDPTVGYLVETSAVPLDLRRVVTSPLINLRPAGGGRLLLQALDLDVSADPDAVPSNTSDLAAELLARLRDLVPAADGAIVERVVVGRRALPEDGRTIVGPLHKAAWLYVVATHSGITLAPFLGEAVAAEIAGEEHALLTPFRPDRFGTAALSSEVQAPRNPGEQ